MENSIQVDRAIVLSFMIGTEPRQTTMTLTFFVVWVPLAYNVILGRPGLNALWAIVSTFHLLMKFSIPYGIDEVWADQMMAKQCYSISLQTTPLEALLIEMLDIRDEAKVISTETTDRLLLVPLDPRLPDQMVKISSELSWQESVELEEALKQNADIFSWSARDMLRVSLEVIMHMLNVDLTCHSVKQKRRNFVLRLWS